MSKKKYQKIAGYWREVGTLQDVIFEHCPECGMELNWEVFVWCQGGGDWLLSQAWEKEWEAAFECDDVSTICDRCEREWDLGRWFYDPDTQCYNLRRPLMPEQAAIIEAQETRKAAIAAGQLEMF